MGARQFLLQAESFDEFLPKLGTELWFLACSFEEKTTEYGKETRAFYCALIPRPKIGQALADPGWDLSKGDGLPGFSVCGETTTYHRLGNDHDAEPLVFHRSYHGLRPSHTEVAEEFRHFHELFLDSATGNLMRIDYDDGSEEIVGRVTARGGYELRMREVREFLAAKDMCLALFFDIVRFADQKDEEPDYDKDKRDDTALLCYSFTIRDGISRFLGKKLVEPLPVGEIRKWPYDEERRSREVYETFIIGTDADGLPIEYTCDPERLSNYFGKNPDAPHYLTPVFFDRAVLQRYFAHSERYKIEDGQLRCAGLWGLRIDNDHPDRVVVALGDLGRDLPRRERGLWKTFNVSPEGGTYSQTAISRGFKAQFTEATRPDLRFKSLFKQFQEDQSRDEWPLLLPLSEADAHSFDALRIPLNETQQEFDGQILALAKLLVDSLNEKELRKRYGRPDDDLKKVTPLVLLERFLESRDIASASAHVNRLRDIQSLRSASAAHRKGATYKKLVTKLSLDKIPPTKTFADFLDGCSSLLEALMASRITGPQPSPPSPSDTSLP